MLSNSFLVFLLFLKYFLVIFNRNKYVTYELYTKSYHVMNMIQSRIINTKMFNTKILYTKMLVIDKQI